MRVARSARREGKGFKSKGSPGYLHLFFPVILFSVCYKNETTYKKKERTRERADAKLCVLVTKVGVLKLSKYICI